MLPAVSPLLASRVDVDLLWFQRGLLCPVAACWRQHIQRHATRSNSGPPSLVTVPMCFWIVLVTFGFFRQAIAAATYTAQSLPVTACHPVTNMHCMHVEVVNPVGPV